MIVISGLSNLALGQELADLLRVPLADVDISHFPNGEKRIWVKSPIEGEDVVILQSFSEPVDEHIIEFTLLADAASKLKAKCIIGVIPWLGYSPQDREFRKGEPVSIEVIAKILSAVGLDHLITIDIHSKASLQFVKIPVMEISALPLFINNFQHQDLSSYVVISLDKGSRSSTTQFAQALNLPMCLFEKTRDPHTGLVSLEWLQGEVKGKNGISIDDFVSTGATRIAAVKKLKQMGLNKYIDCITHAIMAGDTSTKLNNSPIDQFVVTNSYFIPEAKKFSKLKVLSVAPLLADAIAKII